MPLPADRSRPFAAIAAVMIGVLGGSGWGAVSSAEAVSVWSGPLVMAAGVLAVAGGAKAARPAAARAALHSVGVRVPTVAVRALGAAEIAIGTAAATVGGGPAAATVAACYVAFALMSLTLAQIPTGAGCGCFGKTEGAPPGGRHVALNVAAALAAGGAALAPAGGGTAIVTDTPWAGVPALVGCLVGTGLLVAAFTAIPDAAPPAASQRGPRPFHLVEPAAS